MPESFKKKSSFAWCGLLIFVLVMTIIDIWLLKKTFNPPQTDKLPQIKINVFNASSLVIQNQLGTQQTPLDRPLNILVLGRSGGDYISPNLTDTILVVHLDNFKNQTETISLPRDLAVTIPGAKNTAVKINSLYQLGLKQSEQKGLELIKTKAEEVTGLKIDNFVLFDLATVEKIIDTVGGVNVNVKNDIFDTRFPAGPRVYETFSLPSGVRYLDGQTALKFIRTRNNPRGDFERMERQQELLKAVKGKLLGLSLVWDFSKLWSIFSSVRENVKTDLELKDIHRLWSFAKNIELEKVKTMSLNPENNLVRPEKADWGGVMAYILVAKDSPFNYGNIQKAVDDFINPK